MWHHLHSLLRHNWQYIWFGSPFLLLHFLPIHAYFYPFTTVFTHPNDRWMGLCIKQCMSTTVQATSAQTRVYKCIQKQEKLHNFGLSIRCQNCGRHRHTAQVPAFNNVRNLGHVIVLAQAVCKTVLYSLEALSKYVWCKTSWKCVSKPAFKGRCERQ